MNTKEAPEIKEYDHRVAVAAEFLESMDQIAGKISIGKDGKLMGIEPTPQTLGGDLFYGEKYQELIKRFEDGNRKCQEDFSQDPNVIDAKVVNGCVVVIYDSSKGLPLGFGRDESRGDHGGPTSFSTKDEQGYAKKMYRLGLTTIDLNPAKRQDGVSPTTSVGHELRHHGVTITDYIMSQDPQIGMESAYRYGRVTALYGEERDRLTSDAALEADRDKYAAIMERPAAEISPRDIEQQMAYLEELYVSASQGKEDWTSATELVYNNRGGRGKHWEVVGRHPSDQAAAKELLKVLQAAKLCERMLTTIPANSSPIAEQLQAEIPKISKKILSKIGTARGVVQAMRLAREEWDNFAGTEAAKKLITNPAFMAWRNETVYKTGWSVDGLEDLFTVTK